VSKVRRTNDETHTNGTGWHVLQLVVILLGKRVVHDGRLVLTKTYIELADVPRVVVIGLDAEGPAWGCLEAPARAAWDADMFPGRAGPGEEQRRAVISWFKKCELGGWERRLERCQVAACTVRERCLVEERARGHGGSCNRSRFVLINEKTLLCYTERNQKNFSE
jgi:hypothetical protein